jgi:hypothetical protein
LELGADCGAAALELLGDCSGVGLELAGDCGAVGSGSTPAEPQAVAARMTEIATNLSFASLNHLTGLRLHWALPTSD